jgi:tRNA A-37 threonylcarbamoyl transferase component Bud32
MDLTGKKLGKYELIEPLGQGGMAQVYKARQPLIERFVAVKVMQPFLADSEQFVSRFMREAQRLGQLRHPNIVSVIDFDIVDGTHFLVMDYVGGPSLENYLDERKTLPPREALRISSQIANALDYAHEKGVIHLDLKPANVLFQDKTYKQVVLTDFGIARILDASGHAQTSTVIGTPSYISPEAAQGQPLDGRADIYSLGVMMFEMVTGEPPFVAETPLSVMMMHLQVPPPNLRVLQPDVPEAYVQILEKAMAKSPEDRYRSAADMRLAIEAALGNQSGQVGSVRGSQSMSSPPLVAPSGTWTAPNTSAVMPTGVQTLNRRSLPWLWIGVIAFVLVTLVVVGGLGIALVSSAIRGGSPPVALVTSTATTASIVGTQEATPVSTAIGQAVEATQPPAIVPVEPNRYGSLFVLNNDEGFPSQIGVFIFQSTPPPPGSQYVVWVGDGSRFTNLGSLEIQEGWGKLIANVDDKTLGRLTQAQITLESSEASPNAPSTNIVYAGQFSESRLNEYLQLLIGSGEKTKKSYLYGVFEQAVAAQYHQGYALDALNKGDPKEASAHAEHVVNILEGKDNGKFGDVDGNGQIENPGDDVGVLRYLDGAIQHLKASMNSEPLTEQQQALAEQAISIFENSITQINSIIDLNIEMIAAGSVDSMLPMAQQGVQEMDNLIMGESGVGGIFWAVTYGSRAVELPLILQNPAPDITAPETDSLAVGNFQVDDKNGFTFDLNGISTPPKGFVYTLWATQISEGKFTPLGTLPAGEFNMSGNIPAGFFNDYSQIGLSLESEGNSSPASPSRVVMSGDLSPEARDFYLQITTPSDSAPLAKADEQASLAAEHMSYLMDALNTNNLPLAKRHAEHVVNILEGKEGTDFGDVNGDGNLQNPGDGIGVLGYLSQIETQVGALQEKSLPPRESELLDSLAATKEKTAETVNSCFEAALKVISSDTIEEAQGNAQSFQALVQAVSTGMDFNGDGVIDPMAGEGGLSAIRLLASALSGSELILLTP